MGNNTVQVNNYTFDLGLPFIECHNSYISFSRKEFEVLSLLLLHKNQVVKTQQICKMVFPYSDSHTVKSYISDLRKKLEGVIVISTFVGFGYGIFDRFQAGGKHER